MPLKWNYDAALKKLEVGDSFFIPTLDPDALMATIAWSAYELGIKVVTRKNICEGAMGVRVWRVWKADKEVGDAKVE